MDSRFLLPAASLWQAGGNDDRKSKPLPEADRLFLFPHILYIVVIVF